MDKDYSDALGSSVHQVYWAISEHRTFECGRECWGREREGQSSGVRVKATLDWSVAESEPGQR